jgi:UDP-N-acetylglucosamine 2-epimerase (non-hydrolysing)
LRDIMIVCGTRPAIIKLAPLYHALKQEKWARVTWVHSGQHAEMAAQMLACFDIEPDIALERRGTSLFEFSQGCRSQLEEIVSRACWTMIIVQGDTEDAFLGALAGFYHHIPVAHVEAGLRTNDLSRPFPEEGLRQMIGRLAQFHFAPTARAHEILLAENTPAERIFTTGNTVIDAQHWVMARHGVRRTTNGLGHLLVTLHRRENWGHDVEEICHAIASIASAHPDLRVLFPVHLNPIVQQPVHTILRGLPNVRLTAPLGYLEMQQAIADAWLVLTDSGGLQEEAPTFQVPLLVLRDETERPEAIERGCARLVGTSRLRVISEVERLWADPKAYEQMQRAGNPFGDGQACARIVATVARALGADDAIGNVSKIEVAADLSIGAEILSTPSVPH